jgi:hypothetical protein
VVKVFSGGRPVEHTRFCKPYPQGGFKRLEWASEGWGGRISQHWNPRFDVRECPVGEAETWPREKKGLQNIQRGTAVRMTLPLWVSGLADSSYSDCQTFKRIRSVTDLQKS